MQSRRAIFLGLAGFLAACAGKFKTYNGPRVTSVVVKKSNRRMYLMSGRSVLRHYPVELGHQPVGHKQFRGDGKTPEGLYLIDRRNPNSRYHLSLGVSYPNGRDRAFARQHGQSPGGDIFIHGTPHSEREKRDWTAGCIAVANHEVEEIWAMVQNGTPILITA